MGMILVPYQLGSQIDKFPHGDFLLNCLVYMNPIGTVTEFISSGVGWLLEVIVEVMSVFAQVDASPVSTVHIRPGNKVAVCCDVDGGGVKLPAWSLACYCSRAACCSKATWCSGHVWGCRTAWDCEGASWALASCPLSSAWCRLVLLRPALRA